jgi:regulator of protease activity HflC (stomatin/prohibitin superfamily)
MFDIVGTITGLWVVVYDGQHALRFTLGRAKEVVGPGVHFKWPIIQRFRVEETKHTTLDLEPQTIQLSDDLVYEVDCKVMYQIVDLRRAMIEIDDLVQGLKNRVVLAIQTVVRKRNRKTIREAASLVAEIEAELAPIENQWGARILQVGFSNISPSPTTLEITQLELLAAEKLSLYERFRSRGLSSEASVALISGAVVAVQPEASLTRSQLRTEEERILTEVADLIGEERTGAARAGAQGSTPTEASGDDDDATAGGAPPKS